MSASAGSFLEVCKSIPMQLERILMGVSIGGVSHFTPQYGLVADTLKSVEVCFLATLRDGMPG